MPKLAGKNNCCGCSACFNKCAKHAISMQPDTEGFLFPVVNSALCVECSACEKVCPGLSPAYKELSELSPKVFIVQHKNDQIRYQSTSGGAFTAIASETIHRGGVVFGATVSEDMKVKHDFVTKIYDLCRFRNSKYVQSDIRDCFSCAKDFLISGKWVCFSGTPCQINGLYKFLGKDYDNLIAVDVCCKSVPSPLIFEKYKEFKKLQKDNTIVFRDKQRGFSYCTMAHYESEGDKCKGSSLYRRGSESDEWLRLFLSGKISRKSCYTCPFQNERRVGDFTLWDCWETIDIAPEWNDNKGTTNVVVYTEKGKLFFESIMNSVRYKEYDVANATGIRRQNSQKPSANREILFNDANRLSPNAFFDKYAPYSLKVRIKQFGRYLMWKLHLHNLVRQIKHLIIHRKR